MAGRMRGLLERLLARRREAAGDGVSDAELIHRFTRDRDEAAFELLVWRHGNMVLGVCRRTIRDEQLAEDAFQAVFLVLAHKAGAVRGNLGGWLFKVARRVATRARKNHISAQPVIETAADSVPDLTERDEVTQVLDTEVARLPERLRRPVVLCYLGGWSTEDAAREIGCPRGTVLSRLATARKRLAERLTRRGVAPPAALAAVGVSGRLVSTVTAAVSRFLAGSLPVSTATQLANGVIQTMSRATFLSTMGGVLLAASLVTGVGWVAARPQPIGSSPERPSSVTSNLVAGPPVKPQDPVAVAPADANQTEDQKIRKLEQFAGSLKAEIELLEKQADVLTRENAIGTRERVRLDKQLSDLDEEVRRQTHEVFKLAAELEVLEKIMSDKTAPAPNPDLVQNEADQDDAVVIAKRTLQEARSELIAARERTRPSRGAAGRCANQESRGRRKRIDGRTEKRQGPSDIQYPRKREIRRTSAS